MGASSVLDRAVPDELVTDELPVALAIEVDHLAGRPTRWCRADADVHPGVRARALVAAGHHEQARRVLGEVADAPGTPQGVVSAAWAASRVGPPAIVEGLADRVEALDAGFVVQDELPLGPRSMFAGALAAARGDLARADGLLAEAVRDGDRRAPVWGAVARLERARVLLDPTEAAPGDGDRARTAALLLASARTFFAASGHRHLGRVATRLVEPPRPVDAALPGLGHLVPGDRWTVGYGVQPAVPVGATKGLAALRHLIEHRHRRVPAVELDRLLSGQQVEPVTSSHLATGDELRAQLVDDRARSRASKLLRRTIEALHRQHPLLGRHLRVTVRTGYACAYDADTRTRWRL